MTGITTWQKNATFKLSDYAGAGFSKYVFVHRKGVRNEAEGCVTVGSPEPFLGQAVNEIEASEM